MSRDVSSPTSSPVTYRVVWGLGRFEDFVSPEEASARAVEIHEDLVETWPVLAGTNDAVLPKVVVLDA